ADRQTVTEAAAALVHIRLVSVLAGTVAVLGGLAMVLAHSIWSGGVLPVVVTILGWTTLAAGLLLMFLPLSALLGLWQILRFNEFFYVYLTIPLGALFELCRVQVIVMARPRLVAAIVIPVPEPFRMSFLTTVMLGVPVNVGQLWGGAATAIQAQF